MDTCDIQRHSQYIKNMLNPHWKIIMHHMKESHAILERNSQEMHKHYEDTKISVWLGRFVVRTTIWNKIEPTTCIMSLDVWRHSVCVDYRKSLIYR